MKTQTGNNPKYTYNAPQIEEVKLDNQISLALDSAPPVYEMAKGSNAPEYFNNDPFKNCLG